MPIQSQIIPLNVPFIFIYENKEDSKVFMSSDILRKAFSLTMDRFPVLYGRVKSKGLGNISIVVGKDNLNMLDYRESSSDAYFSHLKKHNFGWRSWPDGVDITGTITRFDKKSGEIKLVNVHVVRLSENSGVMIYFSIPHYVLDVVSYMEVMKHWCQIHQLVADEKEENVNKLPVFSWDWLIHLVAAIW